MKISMEKLIESAQAGKGIEPDVITLNEYQSSACRALLKSGYDERNPKLFSDLSDYAARFRLGCQPLGLMLSGGTGCGKTEGVIRLAAMLNIEFVTVIETLKAFGTDEYYNLIAKRAILSGKIKDLIIDEVGDEPMPYKFYGTDYNVIADVLKIRYDAFKFDGARTIITTNKTIKELEQLYGQRVESRCWEMFKIKSYAGQDFRKKKD